jgi:hypothetical protein
MSLSRKLRFVSVFLRANGQGKGGTLHITQAVINARPPCLSGSSELQRGDDQPLDQDRKSTINICSPPAIRGFVVAIAVPFRILFRLVLLAFWVRRGRWRWEREIGTGNGKACKGREEGREGRRDKSAR